MQLYIGDGENFTKLDKTRFYTVKTAWVIIEYASLIDVSDTQLVFLPNKYDLKRGFFRSNESPHVRPSFEEIKEIKTR